LSPQQILSRTPRAFSLTWNTGAARAVEARRGFALIEFRGVTDFNPWLWENLMGATEALVELGGGKDMRVAPRAGGVTSDWMDLELTWK
jgi:hypothetical protein